MAGKSKQHGTGLALDGVLIFWRSGKGYEPRQDLAVGIPVSGELTHPLRTASIPYKGEATI